MNTRKAGEVMSNVFNVFINIENENEENGDCLPGGNGEVTLATFKIESDAESLVDRIIAFSNDQIEGNVYKDPKLTERPKK